MEDEDVTAKKGIYPYVLDGKEKHLNIRAFSPNQKREACERQKGKCPVCKEIFEIDAMEADHITPGTRVAKPPRGTVKCSARKTTAANQEDKMPELRSDVLFKPYR